MRRSSNNQGLHSHKDLERTSLMGPFPLGHNTSTSFRLAKDDDLEQSPSSATPKLVDDSIFGVRSLQDDTDDPQHPESKLEQHDSDTDEGPYGGRRRSTLRPVTKLFARELSSESIKAPITKTTDSSPTPEGPSVPSMSHSVTSLSLDSQAPLSSLPSTPKSTSNRSLHPLDGESTDEDASQAIVSSEDEGVCPPLIIQDSAPQLIMPSIKMPSRRPFTERGKAMGRLKVLIAGDSGVGKTSLIKSIVQACEDIVHVDPLSPTSPSVDPSSSHISRGKHDSLKTSTTHHITEVHASTKPYPSWWSDIEDTKVLHRRKSMSDTVLERNICFVDTPGYSNGMSKMESMHNVLQYIETQLSKPFSALTAHEGDIAGLLSGNGGSQVDAVFYLITQALKDEDMTFLHRLAAVTNVIPLLAQSDTRSFEETEMLRRSIKHLQLTELKLFTFMSDSSSLSYNVSSASADDTETMDASTLMSPDYVQPLIPSELGLLVQQVFDPDNIACLRHLAAKKLVQAQGSRIFSFPTLPRPNSNPRSASPISPPSLPTTARTLVPYPNNFSPYVTAKISDHTQQQEKLAQIRLAKWAVDLQRSLQNERARYEAIARGERALWLKEKLRENTDGAALVRTNDPNPSSPSTAEAGKIATRRGLFDTGDPLGLLKWNDTVRRHGWTAVKLVGSVGFVSAMVLWVVKAWGGSDNVVCVDWTWGRGL